MAFCCDALCPLLAQSGYPDRLDRCPLLGVKRTSPSGIVALPVGRMRRWSSCPLSGQCCCPVRGQAECAIFGYEENMLNETTIATFKSSLRGELIKQSDTRYDTARKVYNGMIDRRPLLIANCADVADVITAVKFGREHKLVVS